MKELCSGIESARTSPYHPETNGTVENALHHEEHSREVCGWRIGLDWAGVFCIVCTEADASCRQQLQSFQILDSE